MMTAALAFALLLQGEPVPVKGPGQGPGPVQPGQSTPPTPGTVPILKPEKPIGTKTYSDKGLGLAFDYPGNWIFQRRDKSRPDRFTIPVEGSAGRGELQVIDLDYRATPETFQEAQATMATRLNGTVERQWQIELLGVPLLLTQLRAATPDGDRTTLVGLLYANTPRKFNFRLSAPTKDFDAVNLSWLSVLETVRTTSGALPATEGTKPIAKPVPAVREVRTELAPRRPLPPTRGPVVAPLRIASSDMALYLPKGWTAAPAGEGVLRLSHPRLSIPLVVQGYLTQADNPESVLARAAARSMTAFALIDRRYDRQFPATRGGGSASAVWRLGTDPAEAPRAAYDAVYTQDAAFLLMTSEATPGATPGSASGAASGATVQAAPAPKRVEPSDEARRETARKSRLAGAFGRSREEIRLLEDLLRTMRLEPAATTPAAPPK